MEIPGYTIERVIGEGGMATVYLAVQQSLERKVALKVMSAQLVSDESFRKRFLKEGRIIAQLHHPRIVTIHDFGVHEGIYYICQEYLPGGTLADEIRHGIPVARALSVVKGIAEALDYAHSRGFVHRDIKPQNILFRSDRARSPVLTDFGIARAITPEDTRLTVVNAFCGSPAYASPEQAKGLDLDGRSDLYSLGIVLFQMLTGQVPYDAQDPVSLGVRHVIEPVPQLPAPLAGRLQALLDRCLAKDPDDRFANADQLMQAVTALEDPVGGHATAAGVQADSTSQATVVLADTAARPGRAAPFVTAGAGRPDHPPRPPNAAAERRPTRTRAYALAAAGLLTVGLLTAYLARQAAPPAADRPSEVTDATTAPAGKAQSQRSHRVLSLFSTADAHEAAGRLFAPAGFNAFDTYQAAGEAGADPAVIEDRVTRLLERQRTLAEQALIDNDYNQSLGLIDSALRSVPDHTGFVRLRASVRQRLAQAAEATPAARQIAQWLEAAQQFLDEGRLFAEQGDSAHALFQRVLAEDPGNAAASAGLRELQERLLAQIQQRLDAGDPEGALALIRQGLVADPPSPRLRALQEVTGQLVARRERIRALLAAADDHRQALRIVMPTGQNAFESYVQVLAIDPDNPAARQGIADLVRLAERLARTAYDKGLLAASLQRIQAGLTIDPKDAALLALRQRVQERLREVSVPE